MDSPQTAGMTASNRWLQLLVASAWPQTALQPDWFVGGIDDVWRQVCMGAGISSEQLLAEMQRAYGFEPADVPNGLSAELQRRIPREVADRFTLFPLAADARHITLAMANPLDQEALSVVGFLAARSLLIQIADPATIQGWISQFYEKTYDHKTSVVIKNQARSLAENAANMAAVGQQEDSAVVQIVSEMLLEAFEKRASDIHVEPFLEGGVVRYRIDGLLQQVATLPQQVFLYIVQRIKTIAGMNVANRLIPQDGSASLMLHGQSVDLRVSTIPVRGGEKAVLRLLVQNTAQSIDEIGLAATELQRLRSVLDNKSGIFVITGPTGSGKTTTLSAILRELNTYERCLVTVEDPVEYQIDGIAQISVNRAQQVTFASALRSILRQDPDVILVGEVRDEETARITFRAALTGHFVMTTLHTNDAITSVPRLLDLGVAPSVLADSVRGLAAQRLVRKLCPHCAQPAGDDADRYSMELLQHRPQMKLHVAAGCDACGQSGYKGRMPLLELIVIDPALAEAIRSGADASTLRELATLQGNRPMAQVALEVIGRGVTSVEEIHRVMGEQFWAHVRMLSGQAVTANS